MNGAAAVAATAHPWSKAALFAKAQRYAEEMCRHGRSDWQFGMWSSLMLEFLARAALAHMNPALLADLKHWNNLYFAVGGTPKKQPKFIPKSTGIDNVLAHLNEAVPDFDVDRQGIASEHVKRRNKELHSGDTAFDAGSAEWLGEVYDVCEVLLKSMGHTLEDLLGKDEADAARKLIDAARDESAKAVKGSIANAKKAWAALDTKDREEAARVAALWATRELGHRVGCPACGSQALFVGGEPIAAAKMTIKNGMVIEKQDVLASKFECVACGLKIAGLARISAAGLANSFTLTRTYDLYEYFGGPDGPDGPDHDGFDDDNNEP